MGMPGLLTTARPARRRIVVIARAPSPHDKLRCPSEASKQETFMTNSRVIRQLATADDQMTFLESYFTCTKRPPERQVFLRSIAADVFKRSYTAGYFVDGVMVGGYCLVLKPPMVELELLPEQLRERHPFILNTSEHDMVSLPMLWLNKELRGPRHSVLLWKQMLMSISGMGRKYLIYCYQLHEQRNWKLYKRASSPTNIYEGILANGGMGGVDCVPIQRLARQIAFLSRFSQRHMVPELEAIPA
jgi:hypothetical protein